MLLCWATFSSERFKMFSYSDVSLCIGLGTELVRLTTLNDPSVSAPKSFEPAFPVMELD